MSRERVTNPKEDLLMDEKLRKPITRRQFIKGIGIGAGVASLGGLSVVEAALLPKSKRNERYDVVVIGTGLSGLVAAVEAANDGARVAVLEKMPQDRGGGNSRLAGGMIVFPSDDSRKARDEYFEDFMKKSMGYGNPVLTRVLAAQSLEGVGWLKNQGIDLTPPYAVPGYRMKAVVFAPGLYKGLPKGLEVLRNNLAKKGGKIFYETKAEQLVMDATGAVSGVRAVDPKGVKDYDAPSVIIASGGYAANGEILQASVDPGADKMMVRGVRWATGDGLKMAREAGAMLVNMGGMASVHVAAVSPGNTSAGNPFPAIPYTIGINKDGKRYVDESKGYVANGKAAMKQPGQTVAMIFDEEIKKQAGVATSFKLFQDLKLDIVEADSINDLANKIKVPPAALEETIKDFNAAVTDGKAPGAKPPKEAFAYKIATAKFYAFYPLVPGITLTFGGIRTNDKAQAQEADGRVIKGLYAAGECAGGLYYDDYVGGGSLANCLVMGRVAGMQAAGNKGTSTKAAKKKD
jgi:flavocytochrome c